MRSSTIASPGRASVAIWEPINVDLAGIVVHEVQNRGKVIELCLSGTRKSTKEFMVSAGEMLIRGEVWPATATIDPSLTVHAELLDAIPHLVRRMELHDYYAVLLIW
jgi:hypothetical protein